MTRTEALKIAQECIQKEMSFYLNQKTLGQFTETGRQKVNAKYAELAQAMVVIENMARQKEMHL